MSRLRPTLWRTCRVLACETRLRMLQILFEEGEVCVADMAARTGISANNASTQLRALNARGLITPRRAARRVLYRAEANQELEAAPLLLAALRDAFAQKMTIPKIFHLCTAFTYRTRIELARVLSKGPRSFAELQEEMNLPDFSVRTNLKKLMDRKFVKREGRRYRLCVLRDPLRRTLLAIALRDQ